MGDMADDFMDRLDDAEMMCNDWCEGCPTCATDDQWVTREGEVLEIKKLDVKHLTNILNFVLRGHKQQSVGAERWAKLRAEAKRRGVYRDPKIGNRYRWSDAFSTKI